MTQSDRAIKKLATDLARLKHEVVSWRGAQADYTSIENGGNFTFKDGDGNVTAIMGGQDDGSNTIRHVSGPVPPIPSGLSAHVDGPIVQVSWDGSFEDADEATYDWSHLEVIAVGPSNEQLTATINDVTGATANLAATVSGEWTVVARSVSRAEKRSLDGDAGTVDVELVGLTGAINDAIGSANGKNTVTYSEVAPAPADEGIAGDTWFVGSVADIPNPNNLAQNATFNTLQYQRSEGMAYASTGTSIDLSTDWFSSEPTSLKITPIASNNTTAVDQMLRENPNTAADAGRTFTISADVHLDSAQTGSLWTHPRRILVRTRYNGFTSPSWRYSDSAPNVAGTHRVKVTFTLPAGLEWWYFMLTNGSSTTPVYWDNLVIEEGTTDGLFWVTNDDGSWNVVEQYRHNGVVWKPVELNHEVISSVDLGKATVGELDGIRIMGQTVRGEQLSGDAIDGKVITGATYRTTGGTGSWSDAGLFIAQPDGTSMVRFPTDGSPLSLTASDTKIERASIGELDVSNGAVRSGGQLTLASGVTAPASPPELTAGWHKITTLEPYTGGVHEPAGLAYWGEGAGHWVRAINVWGSEADGSDTVELYDYVTGERERGFIIDLNPRYGITVMGDIVYVFGAGHTGKSDRDYIDGYDLNTGERVSRHEYTRNIQGRNALGNDGTNLIVASVYNRELWVHRRDPVTGVQSGPDMRSGSNTWSGGANNDLHGVSISGTEVTVVPQQSARVYTIDGGTLTRKTDTANASGFAGWDNPDKNGAGMVWVDLSPYVVDGSGAIYRGAPPISDASMRLCYTWWDGTHETTPSPIATTQVPARQDFRCSLPVRAGLSKRVYAEFSAAPNVWYRTTAGEDSTVVSYFDFSGAPQPLPTTNSFPNADPATLKSTNNAFVVNGDGSGTWGPLTFNPDGTMSSSQVPAWVPITSFESGFEPRSWGDVPAYRIWPDGKVEWRGVISGTLAATGSSFPLLTIPAAARPGRPKNYAVATTGSATARVEFGPTVATTKLYYYTTGTAGTWVAIDGIYYYLD